MKYAAALYLSSCLALLAIPTYGVGQPTAIANTAPAWQLEESNPAELMRRALRNELAVSYGRRPPLRYRLRKVSRNSDTTKQIVETSDGGVARLIARNGKPLSSEQQQQEFERLKALDADASIEKHRKHNETRDAQRMRKFMRLMPDAFLYRSGGQVESQGRKLARLTFVPNPNFSPPDFGSRILTAIRGEVWIDPDDLRVMRIDGKIFKPVDFGWGIIGALYPGGTMRIEQTRTESCGWQLSHLGLHLQGKELIFKSLHIDVEETATDYQWVPRKWNYHDAVKWLLQMSPSETAATGGR